MSASGKPPTTFDFDPEAARGSGRETKTPNVRAFRTLPCGHPLALGLPVPTICSQCYEDDESRLLHALQAVHGHRLVSEAQFHNRS